MYGAKITAIRLGRGYSQEFVAKKLGIDQTTYSKYERDVKVKVDDNFIEKIAEILGVSVADIQSPIPIIMNFHNIKENSNSQFGSSGVQNNSLNEKIFESLVHQLRIKDKQIEDLIKKIK